jgi:hypothetical protein
MLCLAAWCGLERQAKYGNTRVFALLGGKFLGYINVDRSDRLGDLRMKANALLPHMLGYHPDYMMVCNSKHMLLDSALSELHEASSKRVCIAWDESKIQQNFDHIRKILPHTTFDGTRLVITPSESFVTVPFAIKLFGWATTFECFDKDESLGSSVQFYWLKRLTCLKRIDIRGCHGASRPGLPMFHFENVPNSTTHFSFVSKQQTKQQVRETTLDGVERLHLLTNLCVQGILHGIIPDSISNLTSLTSINLAFNKLRGQVPLSLGKLTNLEELFLQHNQLCGRLCVATCTKLRRLNVSHNLFEATLLDDIKLCKSLQEVDTSHNLF